MCLLSLLLLRQAQHERSPWTSAEAALLDEADNVQACEYRPGTALEGLLFEIDAVAGTAAIYLRDDGSRDWNYLINYNDEVQANYGLLTHLNASWGL